MNLLKLQAELKCPKGSFNSFGRYTYRSAEQILESLKPLLQKHELIKAIDDYFNSEWSIEYKDKYHEDCF